MSVRFRIRTFLVAATVICLAAIFVWETGSYRSRIQQLELMEATIGYNTGELWGLGKWTPQWIREANRQPISVKIAFDEVAPQEIVTILARMKSIEILKLSSTPRTPSDNLDLPQLPRLRELDLRFWSGCNLNLESLRFSVGIERLVLPLREECSDQFVKTLPTLPNLKYLLIDAGGLTGDALSALEGMDSLAELDLLDVRSNEVLAHLPTLPSLRKCNMTFGFISEEKVLQCLRAFPQLKELHLSMAEQANVLRHLPRLDQLQVFYCSGPNISVDDIQGLKQAPNLVELEFDLCKFQPDSFDKIPSPSQLLQLRFIACRLPWNCLKNMDQWTSLRQLHINMEDPGDEVDIYGDTMIQYLPPLPELRDLKLNGWVSILGIQQLHKFEKIEKCNVCLLGFNDDHEVNMPQIDTLTTLTLEFSIFSKNGLRVLKQFPNLRTLCLAGSGFDSSDIAHDAFLHSLPPLNELRSLDLSGTAITDDTLFVMHQYENLELLELWHCQNIRAIPPGWAMKLKNLKELNLNMTNLGPMPLEGLGGATSLQILSLRGANVALEDLPVLPGLRTLKINSKKLPITDSFPFPQLPEQLRIETSEGVYSSEELDKLYTKFPGLTVVEQD